MLWFEGREAAAAHHQRLDLYGKLPKFTVSTFWNLEMKKPAIPVGPRPMNGLGQGRIISFRKILGFLSDFKFSSALPTKIPDPSSELNLGLAPDSGKLDVVDTYLPELGRFESIEKFIWLAN